MSRRDPQSSDTGSHRMARVVLASAALASIVAPGIAGAGDRTSGETDSDAQLVADAGRTGRAVIAAYNQKQWDVLRGLYAEDALMLPPNDDPIRGPDAIVEYLRGVRDVAGEIDLQSVESVRVRGSSTLANLVENFTIHSGRVRMIANLTFERQPDGSVLLGVDHFSFRDPAG